MQKDKKPRMKRTNYRTIRLPAFAIPFSGLFSNLNDERREEVNIKSYDYGRRTAIPTLNDYIIEVFKPAFRDITFHEAVIEVGLNSNKLLKGPYKKEQTLDGINFVGHSYRTHSSKYEEVLQKFGDRLVQIESGNAGASQVFVKKEQKGVSIAVEHLISVLSLLKAELTTEFNKTDVGMKDPKTDEQVPLDTNIDNLHVYLNPLHYSRLNEASARNYFKAVSLKDRIATFQKDVEKTLMEKYGVPESNLSEHVEINYELADGTGVRYLFFPKREISHGDIYKSFLGKETENITSTTGDLIILQELAFKDTYNYRHGDYEITVTTALRDRSTRAGTVTIAKQKKKIPEERIYHVFNNENGVYVLANDVRSALGYFRQKSIKTPTQPKIDFFAAIPEYLR